MGTHEPDRERIMSEATPVPTPPVEPNASDAPPADPPKPNPTPEPEKAKDWEAEAEKWKAFARKHEDSAKANAEKAKRFDEFEESNKTELQKAADRAAAAEARVAEFEARTMRAEVAAAKGIPANLLSGSTQEELEASADALLEFRGEKPPPDFGGGDRGDDIAPKGKQLSRAALADMTPEDINQAKLDGRLDVVLGIKPKS